MPDLLLRSRTKPGNGTQGGIAVGHIRAVVPIALGCLFASVVFWLPIVFFWSGVSPSTQFEESVGYRYFFAMRNAFGGEYPWVPQGHLPALFHRMTHFILDTMGYPRDDLYARVDLFSFLAVLVPLIVTALFAAAVFRRTNLHPLIVATVFASALVLLLPGTPNGWTVMPDYHVWVVPLSLAALLAMVGVEKWRPEVSAVLCGVLAAAAVTTKLSFAVFALPVFGALLDVARRRQRTAACVALTGVGFCAAAGAVCVTYFPSLDSFWDTAVQFQTFAASQANTLPRSISIAEPFTSEPYVTVALCAQLLLLAIGFKRSRFDLLALAAGGILVIAFVALRFYSHSLIELHAYLFLEGGILGTWASRVGTPQMAWALAGVLGGAAVVLIVNWSSLWAGPISLLHYSQSLQEVAASFELRLRERAERVWVLTTGNAYRPNSIHSALCKGGTDILVPYWGASPYLTDLFPHFRCATVSDGVTQPDLLGTSVGFLRYPDESVQTAVERVEKFFSVSLNDRSCSDIPASGFGYVVCDPPLR